MSEPYRNEAVGGAVGATRLRGCRTDRVADCVVVAAMQRQRQQNGLWTWTHYFFAHLLGGAWTDADAEIFNENITNAANAYIALYSTNTRATYLRDFVLPAINERNRRLGGVAIPEANGTFYDGDRMTFALRFADAGIGEVDPRARHPIQKGNALLGTQNITFDFSASATSTRTVQKTLNPPAHTETATIALTGSDIRYTDDKEYGFGKFQVELSALSEQSAQATVTLRDDHTNKREWEGRVQATVMFFQSPDE